jgi:hypothetical protein
MRHYLHCYRAPHQSAQNRAISDVRLDTFSLQELKRVSYEVPNWQMYDAILPSSQQRHNLILRLDTEQKSSVFTAHISYCCTPFSSQDIHLEKIMEDYKNDHRSRMMNILVPHFPVPELKSDMPTKFFFSLSTPSRKMSRRCMELGHNRFLYVLWNSLFSD